MNGWMLTTNKKQSGFWLLLWRSVVRLLTLVAFILVQLYNGITAIKILYHKNQLLHYGKAFENLYPKNKIKSFQNKTKLSLSLSQITATFPVSTTPSPACHQKI